MSHESTIDEKEREHFAKCAECKQWFDMRDLSQVLKHEHWLKQDLHVKFSHVKKLGKPDEVYLKVGSKMITMKRKI